MNQDEKRTVRAIRRAAETVPVPASLEPDAVMGRLEAAAPATVRRPRRGRWLAAAAAVLVLAIGVGTSWGLGLFGSASGPLGGQTPAAALVFGESSPVRAASGYDEVAACFEAYRDRIAAERDARARSGSGGLLGLLFGDSANESDALLTEGSAAAGDTGASAAIPIAGMDGDFSTTNLRTEGVDEADVAKTDGTCLYVLIDDGARIAIVRADAGLLEELGTIEAPGGRTIAEFYLEGGRLFALTTTAWYESDNEEAVTEMITFDVSDPARPVEVGRVSQSGTYCTSRFSDGYLYAFSLLSFYENAQNGDPGVAVPTVDGRTLNCEDIFLPADGEANGYLVVTAVDAADPTGAAAEKGLLHCSGELYVSPDSIYVYEENRRGKNSATDIVRLAYDAGKVTAAGQCTVRGTVNDSFSIDEYDDNLRVVTTIYGEEGQTTNALFVLNGAMDEVGSIVGLASGETVQSARFMGDVGYFVTFRQVDPLFTVDLSDPAAPKIVGELKIPGFSAYLHPYGQDRLLGIGWDAGEGGTGGAKLTMFDTSDPTAVTEAATLVLEDVWDVGPLRDYRAALVEPDRNLIGFAARGLEAPETAEAEDAPAFYGDAEQYYLFSYDEGEGFVQNLKVPLAVDGNLQARGLRIGEVLYVATGSSVESFRLYDGEPVAALEL